MSWQRCAYGLVRLRLKNHLVRVRKRSCLGLKHLVLCPQTRLEISWCIVKMLLCTFQKSLKCMKSHIFKSRRTQYSFFTDFFIGKYEYSWRFPTISWFLEYSHLQPSLWLTLYFKPKHDLFWTLTEWLLSRNLNRPKVCHCWIFGSSTYCYFQISIVKNILFFLPPKNVLTSC